MLYIPFEFKNFAQEKYSANITHEDITFSEQFYNLTKFI